MTKLYSKFSWKKYHRWFGLVLSVFMLVFCVSGIILNHRTLFSGCEVSRSLLPSSYHIKNFNNGIIKGTVRIPGANSASAHEKETVLAYGCGGVWLTDTKMSVWRDFNNGLPESIDERNIRNVVRAKDGSLWCAALHDVYRYDAWDGKKEKSGKEVKDVKKVKDVKRWQKVTLAGNDERIMDVTLNRDSTKVVALTRSKIYEISIGHPLRTAQSQANPSQSRINSSQSQTGSIQSRIIPAPKGYEPKTTLFKIVWHLHSGELFGLPGKLVVDAIAVVLIILSLTGIVLFILPYRIRRWKNMKNAAGAAALGGTAQRAKERMLRLGKQMVWHQKWHNKIGYLTIVLTLWVAITGMCLRPPLMVPLVLNPVAEKVGEDGNVWQDKLRAIRWDEAHGCWLVSTSDGFLMLDEACKQAPVLLAAENCPKLSPMGVTVFEKDGKGGWIVGSFRGMYRWLPMSSGYQVLDYFTNKPSIETSMIPISDDLICGYSADFFDGKPLVFDFAKGMEDSKGMSMSGYATEIAPIVSQPEMLSRVKMSLWNVALELHVGRCYAPFLGPLSDLFVFVSGLLITLVLLSGYIILRRRKKKGRKRKNVI